MLFCLLSCENFFYENFREHNTRTDMYLIQHTVILTDDIQYWRKSAISVLHIIRQIRLNAFRFSFEK